MDFASKWFEFPNKNEGSSKKFDLETFSAIMCTLSSITFTKTHFHFRNTQKLSENAKLDYSRQIKNISNKTE